MKNAAFFAALVMLACSETSSCADDYLSGYLDLSYLHYRSRGYDDGQLWTSQRSGISTLGGAVQYRLDDCAAGLKVSESLYDSESRFYGKYAVGQATLRANGTSTSIGTQAGCRVEKLWIVGLGGAYIPEEGNRVGNYGLGLYYIFDDQYRLGFSAEKYRQTDFFQWMEYSVRSNYFVNDDVKLSASLKFEDNNGSKAYGIFSRVEYKPNGRPVSFYAGLGADWYRSDESAATANSVSATAGIRFYFNEGSLKTIVNNSMPDFGD